MMTTNQVPEPNENNAAQTKADRNHRILTIIGAVLCVILIPMLIINCTLIVKSFINKEEVPDFGGMIPLIVLTDSMYPEIKSGDLIVCKTIEAEDVEIGDVISFFDPAGNGTAVVTHEVIDKYTENGTLYFKTKGTNNNTEDRLPVPAEKLVGIYADVRIPAAGNIALFMQTVPGLIVCVVVPIVLLVGYDILRRRKYEKSQGDEMANLMAELEALRAATNANAGKLSDEPADAASDAASDAAADAAADPSTDADDSSEN